MTSETEYRASKQLRILQIHNRYRALGGEDIVLANEAAMLRQHGHEVELLEVTNPACDPTTFWEKLVSGARVVWSRQGAAIVRKTVLRFRPNVVHFHNTFSMLSPAAVNAVRQMGVPVVQTLHNYRLVCANGLLMRNGAPCQACIDGSRINAIRYACYRGNRAASTALVLSSMLHLKRGTYVGEGIRLIALTEFARNVLTKSGVDSRAIFVKPNFVFPMPLSQCREKKIVFVGRLSEEKGVDLILDAWRAAKTSDWVLELIGDGPQRSKAEGAAKGVEYHGWLESDVVRQRIASARFLVLASRSFEGLPMVILEALSVGTPVLLPRLGGLAEILDSAECGLGFEAGSVDSLKQVLTSALNMEETEWLNNSAGALALYNRKYSVEINYGILMSVYNKIISEMKI